MDTIVIQGLDFNVPSPYTAGHVLAENEASALNQLLHENLRNNFAAKVKKAKEEGNLDGLQAALDEYAAGYSFGVRSVSGIARSPSKDAVTREAEKLATAAILAAIKGKGLKVDKAWKEENLERLVSEAIEKHPKFREQAEQIVATRRDAAQVTLGDLGV